MLDAVTRAVKKVKIGLAAEAATAEAKKVADQQAADTAASTKQYQDSLIAMSKNAQKLADANNAGASMANISNVITGGTAGAVSTLRKKRGQTLSSSLGINF